MGTYANIIALLLLLRRTGFILRRRSTSHLKNFREAYLMWSIWFHAILQSRIPRGNWMTFSCENQRISWREGKAQILYALDHHRIIALKDLEVNVEILVHQVQTTAHKAREAFCIYILQRAEGQTERGGGFLHIKQELKPYLRVAFSAEVVAVPHPSSVLRYFLWSSVDGSRT